MIAQNTTLYPEICLTDFFPISDVFSANDGKLPRILVESRTSCQIPIIVFSEIEESPKREILNAGADDFLLKPLNSQQLETSIEKQIDNRNITFGGLL